MTLHNEKKSDELSRINQQWQRRKVDDIKINLQQNKADKIKECAIF